MIAAIVAFALSHAGWIASLVLGGGGLLGMVARIGLGGVKAKLATHRSWLTLLAVAGAAAWLYAHYAAVRADRDAAYAWRVRTCAAVGIDNAAPTYRKGDCYRRVLQLAALERDTLKASNTAFAGAIADGNRKTAADVQAAQTAAREAREAQHSMEKANASIGTDDRVGSDWFAALNRAAGLRAD